MPIALIAAFSINRAIGKDNTLPWRLPEDLQRFKRLTLHHTVIMGRRTFESLPGPLRDRHCLIVSRDPGFRPSGDNISVTSSLKDALDQNPSEEIFIAGGASLYAQTLGHADRLYLTEVQAVVAGDAFFPEYNADDWREVASEYHPADTRHAHAFRFVTLDRKP